MGVKVEGRCGESVVEFNINGMKKQQPIRIRGSVFNQFAVEGTWLRANFHCHLARVKEDPQWPVTALEHYKALGYDVVGGMCHDRIIVPDPVDGIIVMPGAEVSCGGHLLGIGIESIPEGKKEGERIETISEMVRAISDCGGISVLAHPFKSAYTWNELGAFCDAGLDGIEVVNSNVRGKGADSGRADQLWHNLLREGRLLIAIGNDDAHGPHEDIGPSGWGGIPHIGFTGILVKDRSREGVVDALRAGRTYASEGPEIRSVSIDGEGLMTVRCSPCVACHFRSVGGSWGGASSFPEDGSPDAGEFTFDFAQQGYRVSDYMTVVLQDVHGRRAWSSPVKTVVDFEEVN